MSQFTNNRTLLSTKRSGDHRRHFRDASHHRSEYFPAALRWFPVDRFSFTEASEVRYKLSNLRSLSVFIERETSLPSASLPNLTRLPFTCDNEDDWLRPFHGATLRKLKTVTFIRQSEQIGGFLGAFNRAALSSVQNTLSEFCLVA